MKTTLTILTLALSLFATSSFAAPTSGSKIKKSKIIVKSTTKGSKAIAKGKNSTANIGGVDIRGSKIKKSKIIVKSKTKGSKAIAVGKNTTAVIGGVSIK
jgi:hypothetical protein